jgi:dGTPase
VELEEYSRTLEAEVMDWADDIAYSVHDVEDFFRAGLIPLGTWTDPKELHPVYKKVIDEWRADLYGTAPDEERLDTAAGAALFIFALRPPFRGTSAERSKLRAYTSQRISTLVNATSFTVDGLRIEPAARTQVELLKQLTRHYVVGNAALATQQYGQRHVVRELYRIYRDALSAGEMAAAIFPPRTQDEVQLVRGEGDVARPGVRVVADVVAGMTEPQAIRVYQRLAAIDFGPLLDPAVL